MVCSAACLRALRLAIVCIVAGAAGAGLAWTVPAWAATKVTTIEGFSEYHLDNGLQVLVCPDVSKPTVTVNLTIFVGSRHEGYGETGMAHLLEHMLFKGTPTHTQIPKALQEPEPASTAPPGLTARTITRRCRPRTIIWSSGWPWKPTG